MQAGRWNEGATQTVLTRIVVNGVTRRGRARIDSQCYEGHPSKAGRSPAATCTLDLEPPWSTSSVGGDPIVGSQYPAASWPPVTGQSVTVDVGDGVTWWRCFTGRVDETKGGLSQGRVHVECVDESVRLDLRAPRAARHHAVAFSDNPAVTTPSRPGPYDLGAATLVDHAARAGGWHSRFEPAWDCNLFVPMVGSAHPVRGNVAYGGIGPNSSAGDRTQWVAEGGHQVGNKAIVYELGGTASSPVEITMDLPVRASGTGWTVATARAAGDPDYGVLYGRGPFLAYDHNQNVIRFGIRDSSVTTVVPVPEVTAQGTPIPRGTVRRVTLRFTPSSGSQHRFEVRTNTGATVDVQLADSSGAFTASWGPKYLEYMSGGPMGALQVVCNPAGSFYQLATTPTAHIRYLAPPWLDATRDLQDMTARDVLTKLADAEMGAFWVDRHGHLQYAGPHSRESQAHTATLTTDLDIIGWSWTYSFEQRAKQLRISRLECATIPSKYNTLLWGNESGSESLGAGELWEKIVTAADLEDWLWVDTTSIRAGSTSTSGELTRSTSHGGTLINSEGGEAWEAFGATWGLQRLGNRTMKWSAQASTALGTDHAVDLRIPTNATNLPTYWRGRSLPRLLGSRIEWAEKTEQASTSSTLGTEEYEHDASWFVQNSLRLADLKGALAAALSSVLPVFDAVPVRGDPRPDVGDRLWLEDKHRAFIRYDSIVLGTVLDAEDGACDLSLKVRVVGFEITDSAALEAALLNRTTHWLQNQASWTRTT